MVRNILFVPIVDSFNVAEDDFVFAFSEVIGSRKRWNGDVTQLIDPSVHSEAHQSHVSVDDLAQVSHVVSLRFNQFLYKPTIR